MKILQFVPNVHQPIMCMIDIVKAALSHTRNAGVANVLRMAVSATNATQPNNTFASCRTTNVFSARVCFPTATNALSLSA